ncbi:MAG: YIP1 family protein [Promethearchaeota archaeon]
MEFFQKIGNFLIKPTKAFLEIEKEKSIKKAFIYFLILSLFSILLTSIILYINPTIYNPFVYKLLKLPPPKLTFNLLLLTICSGFIGTIIASFIISGIIYLWLRMFGGKKPYKEAYKLFVYSRTPKLIFGWIPLVNLVIGIYSLVLLIIGTHVIYKFSKLKSTMIYLIPLIIIFVIGILLLFLGIALLALTIPEGGTF